MCNNAYVVQPMKILSIMKETDIDWTFRMEYSGDLVGGQFFQICLPGVGETPISISDFTDSTVDLTIRKVGKVTDQIFEKKKETFSTTGVPMAMVLNWNPSMASASSSLLGEQAWHL